MSHYPEPDGHIRYEVKAVLDLSNYSTKKELKDDRGFDTSNLSAKTDFIALKEAEVELLNVLTGLNNLKTRVEYLDADELKAVLIDFKKLSDTVSKKDIVEQTKYKSK